ncbi:MAG: carboxypeptidase regulatory-like domain-containing protein [Bryobacteraceae bacterium]
MKCLIFASCLLLAAFASDALAQTATLRGQVTDQTGALVPGARVTLTGPGNQVQSTAADSNAIYSFTALAPGNYTLTGSAPDLVTPRPTPLSLAPGTQTLNLQLDVVTTTQKLVVQETTSPTVSTDPSNNAGALVLRGDDLQALSDDPDDLASDLQALAGPSAGPGGGTIFVDGFSGGELPPKDSIREIRINQNPFAPEYDRLGYGRVEIFTKPGSDHYRGTLDYNYANDIWNSRNPYSAQKAPLLLNEIEGNVGGPISQHASFVFDGQRNTVDNGAIVNAIALNPQTLGIQPYFSIYTVPQALTRGSPRIDYRLNDNNTLQFRYSITQSDINGAGIGTFDLPSRGYDYGYLNQTVQVTETAVLGASINETRFQYFRSAIHRLAKSDAPEIEVIGAFNDGGSQLGRSHDTQNTFELQNYTTTVKGAHVWKYGIRLRGYLEDNVSPNDFNGTFIFNSIESYRQTLLGTPGAGPAQFTINAGQPRLAVHQADLGAFVGDDWRVRPNITLSLGLRYETQTNIHDWRDFAPRLAVAWAPGGSAKNPRPKTVLRAGYGIFYDRFALANILTARRYNGLVQQQYVITAPDFFPSIPPLGELKAAPQPIEELSSSLRAPYIMQSSVTVERQLPWNTTLAVTYTNSHGLHELLTNDINAPLPGTYLPGVAGSGVFPLGQPNPVFLMQSSGLYNQNQLVVNVNARVNAAFSLFGFYVLNRAMSNTDGLGTSPPDPYNFAGQYGPAATDVRNRATLGGTINTRWNVRLNPFIVVQSGVPFDITTGSDLYGTTLFDARPGFATDPNKPGVVQTTYGLLDPNPTPDEKLVPRNFGRGPGQISVNLRISKTFGFGGEKAGTQKSSSGQQIQTVGAANPNLATGRGLGSIIAAPSTSHRYNFSVSMAARNVLNHTNPGPIVGDITSPLFGQANQTAGTLNGEGFSENADNRRLELQLRFTF